MENIFRGNVIVLLQPSPYLQNEDLTPSAFWVTHPNNILDGNAVVASTHYGYRYHLLDGLSGLSRVANRFYRPDQQSFGRFVNNTVHSCGKYGIWIYPSYTPALSTRAVLEGFASWRNEKGIEYVRARVIQIKGALVFDNSDTGIACLSAVDYQEWNSPARPLFYNAENGSVVLDSWIIGNTQLFPYSSSSIPNTTGLIGKTTNWIDLIRHTNI